MELSEEEINKRKWNYKRSFEGWWLVMNLWLDKSQELDGWREVIETQVTSMLVLIGEDVEECAY